MPQQRLNLTIAKRLLTPSCFLCVSIDRKPEREFGEYWRSGEVMTLRTSDDPFFAAMRTLSCFTQLVCAMNVFKRLRIREGTSGDEIGGERGGRERRRGEEKRRRREGRGGEEKGREEARRGEARRIGEEGGRKKERRRREEKGREWRTEERRVESGVRKREERGETESRGEENRA